MMDRRLWVIGTAGLVAGPLLVSAQTPALPRIGVLLFGSAPGGANPDPGMELRDGLLELGYAEGKNIQIEWRYADARADRMAALAADLVQKKVTLIVAGGPTSIHAARAATDTIPIVAVGGTDPVGPHGWAQSLARPGGNTTGLTVEFPELGPKKLEILKEALPGLARTSVLAEPSALMGRNRSVIAEGARALGLELQWLEVNVESDFEHAFKRASEVRSQAVYAPATNLIVEHRRLLAALAHGHRLPSISNFPLMAEAGFLMSYGADLKAVLRHSASYVARILDGARPGELPIERPRKFELVVNLGVARELGITLPAATLRRAQRLIQ